MKKLTMTIEMFFGRVFKSDLKFSLSRTRILLCGNPVREFFFLLSSVRISSCGDNNLGAITCFLHKSCYKGHKETTVSELRSRALCNIIVFTLLTLKVTIV